MSELPLTHQIWWKNKTNSRMGMGPARFDEAKAKELADELNEEYPDFEHQAVPVGETPVFKSTISPAHGEAEQLRPKTQLDYVNRGRFEDDEL